MKSTIKVILLLKGILCSSPNTRGIHYDSFEGYDESTEVVDLSYKGIGSLGSAIGALENLNWLNLSVNLLEELPNEFCDLVNLENLDIWGNRLKLLPDGIGNLKEMNLSENQLKVLPKSFDNLANLEKLLISNNGLTSLPTSIGKLTKLKVLDLSENKLTVFPDEVCKLENLEELRISNNGLKSLPKNIGNLKKLKEMNLNDNKLKGLPKKIEELSGILKRLYLRRNDIQGADGDGTIGEKRLLELFGDRVKF